MWKWLLTVLAFLFPVNHADNTDYVGEIAAHVAYAATLPSAAPTKPKVPTKDCTNCNGTGRVRTGDSNNPWTKCPDCEGPTGDTLDIYPAAPGVKTPKSDPDRYKQPAPVGTRLVQ
jgi:hypothetical protein